KNTFLIVGYCTPDTPGGKLRDGATSLKIFNETKTVRADVEVMDSFSAHGDRNEMYNYISNQKKKLQKLFLVHGEYDTQQSWRSYLGNNGFNQIEIPAHGQIDNVIM
ncbi:MAG TPA: MBL fold metallo-hydrolase RNA specificity domain-containing protein, partial [Saprospiraceae bacterium]|nr:MBL fold metallo-hydrolase RNA specificity domain-containing protein [Saprospiraceae bacterium]